MSSFDHHPIETIRLDDREKRQLVEAIKKPKSQQKGPARGVRVPYESSCVTVSITNPGGNMVTYSVISRNLSRRGIAFLHGRFIYPDSRCDIVLQTLDGESMTMGGTIVRCDHLAGTIHEVAAVFSSPVDLTLFANMTPTELVRHTDEYENDVSSGMIERGPVELGTVLLADSCVQDRRLYSTYLDRAGYICRDATNTQEAMSVIDSYQIDIAVVDVCQDPEYGIDLITKLSEVSFRGPILAVSADEDDKTRELALAAGAQVFMPKPIDGEALRDRVNQLVGNESAGEAGAPILSTYGGDEMMRPLLRDFIIGAREIAGELRSAERSADMDYVRRVCRQLKGSGGGYGFPDVTLSAGVVVQTLDTSPDDFEGQRAAVSDLLDVLGRIRAA